MKRRVTIAESVEQCKVEVLEMLNEPLTTSRGVEIVRPSQIKSFGDLHDYCDANVLGWLCDTDVVFVDEQGEIGEHLRNDGDNDRWMEFGNKVQDEVDAWIKAGGHDPGRCPACGEGRLFITVQALATKAVDDSNPWVAEGVSTDDFISMACDNQACKYALEQSPGDGRVRRASLTLDGREIEDQDELLEKFYEAAEKAITATP